MHYQRILRSTSTDYQQRVLELCLAQRQYEQQQQTKNRHQNEANDTKQPMLMERMPQSGEEIALAA